MVLNYLSPEILESISAWDKTDSGLLFLPVQYGTLEL